MNTTTKIALLAITAFAVFAGASFIGSKHVPHVAPTTPQLVPVVGFQSSKSKYDFSKAKTVADLPPGTIPADGAEIFNFTTREDGTRLGIDGKSWKLENGIATFLVVGTPPLGTVSAEGDVIRDAVIKQAFDCAHHTYKSEYSILISVDKKILSTKTDYDDWRPINPGTMGEKIEGIVCTPPDGTPVQPPAPSHKPHTWNPQKPNVTTI